MKVFGKKTLALVLTIAMALSLCSFTAFAEEGDKTVNVNEDTTLTVPLGEGESATWSINAGSDYVTLKGNNSTATVKGVKKGTATIVATVKNADETVADKLVSFQVTVNAKITELTKTNANISVEYGTTKANAISGLTGGWTATYEGGTTESYTIEKWDCANYNPKAPGEYVFTATVDNYTGTAPQATVTVKQGVIKSYETVNRTVPVGTSESVALATLPTEIKATLVGDATETFRVTWSIVGSYGNAEGTQNQYSGQVNLGSNFAATSIVPAATVKATGSRDVGDIKTKLVIESSDASVNLKSVVESTLKGSQYGETSVSSVNFLTTSLKYGKLNSNTYTADSISDSASMLTENSISFTAIGGSGVYYSGTVTVQLLNTTYDLDEKISYTGGDLSSIAGKISDRLYAVYGEEMKYITFTRIEGETVKREEYEGGTLYLDNKCDDTAEEDEEYTLAEMKKMFYLPNGSGYNTEITYVAQTTSSRETVEGVITLTSDKYLLLSAELSSDESLAFDSDLFVEAVEDWDDDWTLSYVTFTKPSSSDGYLCYEHDDDEKSHSSIVTTSKGKYYVDEDDGDYAIDDITYFPGKNTSGVVAIKFKAYLVDGKKTDDVEGVYQINVIEKADLTIEAGVKESVSFDLDMFQEFYQENISKTYKNYDIVAVSFSGVPNSKEKGYLRNDGKSIKSPNDKKFYIDSDKEGDYAFEDLTFEGGSKASTTRAEFTVYAKKDGKGTAKTVTGTIDFIVGSTHSLSGSIKASETMKFAASLSAFEDLGGNDNVYVTFTGLPTGGKLVYNWGTGSQEDVKVGTEYYLSYKAGKKLLSNVTFVPSYSSSKQARTISIPVKAYNSKEKAVTGTINITVNYAAYSSKFTDITTSTYADSVDFLYNQGITTGMTTTTFGPNSNVTRAQFVTFLYRAAGQPAVTGVTNKFTDVKSTGTYAYAYNAILWAVQNNITTGRSATKFDPAANVTHQELLTFLYRYDVNYLGHPGTQGSLSGFSDASSLQSYAVAPAKWAAYKGIIDGYTLQPAVAGSRATVALWLHRMLTL